MKLSYALLWTFQASALVSAAAVDSRSLASTILGEIESAASCAGCDVRLSLNCPASFQLSTASQSWLSNIQELHPAVVEVSFLFKCHKSCGIEKINILLLKGGKPYLKSL
jgi:hypothetical protein